MLIKVCVVAMATIVVVNGILAAYLIIVNKLDKKRSKPHPQQRHPLETDPEFWDWIEADATEKREWDWVNPDKDKDV